MKKWMIAFILAFTLSTSLSAYEWAPYYYNQNSLTPKEVAMQSFVAVADDLSAIYWNPAGLAQIKDRRISISYSYHRRADKFLEEFFDEGYEGDSHSLSSIGVILPMENVVIGIGRFLPFYQKFSWGDWGWSYEGVPVYFKETYEHRLDYTSIAISSTPNEPLSLGIAGNLISKKGRRDSKWGDGYYNSKTEGSGFGFTAGALLKSNNRLNIGIAYNSGGRIDWRERINYNNKTEEISGEDNIPPAISAGIAFKKDRNTTLSAEIICRFWSQFEITEEGKRVYPNSYNPCYDVSTYCVGIERIFLNKRLPIRAGIGYIPDSYSDKDNSSHIYSIGAGYQIKNDKSPLNNFNFDVSIRRQTDHREFWEDFDKTSDIFTLQVNTPF